MVSKASAELVTAPVLRHLVQTLPLASEGNGQTNARDSSSINAISILQPASLLEYGMLRKIVEAVHTIYTNLRKERTKASEIPTW